MADSWFADCADFADCEDCADCGKVEADCKLHIFTTGLKCKNLLFILALDIKMCHTQSYHICATFISTTMQLCTFHNFEQIIANKHYKSVKLPLHHNLGPFKGSLGGCTTTVVVICRYPFQIFLQTSFPNIFTDTLPNNFADTLFK